MKSVTLTQTVSIEGTEYPAGTKVGVYEARPGINFDYVIGLLHRGCITIADDDGNGFEGAPADVGTTKPSSKPSAPAADANSPFPGLEADVVEALLAANISTAFQLQSTIESKVSIRGIGKAGLKKINDWFANLPTSQPTQSADESAT